MYIIQIHHYIQPDQIGIYKQATRENVKKTLEEPGVLRFDVFQDKADPSPFCLLEIYKDQAAQLSHFETDHFKTWRDMYFSVRAKIGTAYDLESLELTGHD